MISISLLCFPFILLISDEENDDKPLARLLLFSFTTRIFSPFSKTPSILIMPAANKLLPLFNARAAP